MNNVKHALGNVTLKPGSIHPSVTAKKIYKAINRVVRIEWRGDGTIQIGSTLSASEMLTFKMIANADGWSV